MAAIDELKKLVMKGYLSKEVTVEGVKFTIYTLTTQEELEVFTECNISEYPKADKEFLAFVPAVLKRTIKKVNDEAMTGEVLAEFVSKASPVVLGKIYGAYTALVEERLKAGNELKNSSATPSLDFIGK